MMGLEKADKAAHQALELAEHSVDDYQIFCGSFVAGLFAADRGEYLSARRLLERAAGISDQTQAAILADPSMALGMINTIGHLGLVLWILGYPDQASHQEARINDLLSRSLDPTARALGIGHLLTIHLDFLRDERAIHVRADEEVWRSIQGGHRFASVRGLISLGRLMVAEGRGEAGIAKIGEGMLAFEAAGDNRLYDMSSYVAISAYCKMNRVADGIALVERALCRIAQGGMRLFEADLHRLKGEFLLMAGRPENEAEAAFRNAITIARQRQAKSFELRAK
jgi:hypothetical protein